MGGYNNMYLQKSQHNLALLYNDRSILENYHTYLCFRLIQEHRLMFRNPPAGGDSQGADNGNPDRTPSSKEQFLPIMQSADYGRFRNLVVELILTTDTKFHFDHLAQFRVQ